MFCDVASRRSFSQGAKENGMSQMLELSGSILANYQRALAQAEAAGDQDAIKQFKELVDFLTPLKTKIDELSKDYSALSKQFEEKESQSVSLKSDLIEIESRLLKIRKYYNILN